jgi:hypothetical protein
MAWAAVDPGGKVPRLAIGAARAEWDLCKQIPGCTIDHDDGIWRANLSWPVWACFRTIWQHQPISISPALLERETAWWGEVTQRYADRAALDAPPDWVEKLTGMDTPGHELSAVQRGAVYWLSTYRRAIYGDERGNGKTPPLIRSMQLLHETGELSPCLVVCPPAALLGWQEKLAEWAPELRSMVIAGTAGNRVKAIEKIASGDADVGLIAWENARFHTRLAVYPGQAYVRCDAHGGQTGKTIAACEVHPKEFQGITWGEGMQGFRTVIPDEAHRMADPTSKQTRAVWWLMHRAENTWPTTGTLTPNDVGNLWPIQHGVDPLGYPVRSRWLALVADRGFAFANKGEVILDIRADNRPTYEVCTLPMFRRIPKAVARAGQPGLAEPEYRYPTMSPKQEKTYRAIVTAGLAELSDSDLVTERSIEQFTRCCQLAFSMIDQRDGEDKDGFPKPEVFACLPSHKIADLIEFLADNPGQWIIGVNSPQAVAMAEKKLAEKKITSTKIIGGMSYQAKHEAGQAFQRGEVRVIFVNEAGRESIDLYAAEGIYWLQISPSFVHREQMTGRGDRWGQTSEFREVVPITPGTVDVRLWELTGDKEERHQSVTMDAKMMAWLMSVQPGEINRTERQGQWQQ